MAFVSISIFGFADLLPQGLAYRLTPPYLFQFLLVSGHSGLGLASSVEGPAGYRVFAVSASSKISFFSMPDNKDVSGTGGGGGGVGAASVVREAQGPAVW